MPGLPKHVLHLVWIVYCLYKVFLITLKVITFIYIYVFWTKWDRVGNLLYTPSHTATGPWPPPAPYYPPEWRSQLEEGARREHEKVEIDEVEATNINAN